MNTQFTANEMRSNYLIQLFGTLSLSLYCGGMMYQGFVETPARLSLEAWKPRIKDLARSLEICTFYLPLLLLPGIVLPIVRYCFQGHVLFLVGGIVASLILPITGIFLIADYNTVKGWRDDENFDYENENNLKIVKHVTNKIRGIHFFKAGLSYLSLLLFIIASALELDKATATKDLIKK